ncbi:MAG: hypothetical protein JW895_02835 [Thermoleophilaceae bacterium]|nr:hypothetical protein [Thermoleophilaceae bacterium]
MTNSERTKHPGIRRRGDKWVAQWLENGKQRSQTVDTLEDAERLRRERRDAPRYRPPVISPANAARKAAREQEQRQARKLARVEEALTRRADQIINEFRERREGNPQAGVEG